MRSPVAVALLLAMTVVTHASSAIGATPPRPCGELTGGPVPDWLQRLDRLAGGQAPASHPLIGRVVFSVPPSNPEDCRASDLLSVAVAAMAERSVVLLGEVHDNPVHHRFRAGLIAVARERSAARPGPEKPSNPALVFEHIRADQAGALTALQQTDGTPIATSADAWLAALDWDKSGWPDKAMFKALFEEAIAGRHPVYAGEPMRGVVRDISRQGFAAVTASDIKRLGLDAPLPEPQQNALLDDLEASHCGLMPRSAFVKMAEAQRYRDAHLASVVAQAAQTHGAAILLAGNGHVRRDRGVPHYLARPAFAIALVEVEDGKTSADDYMERGPDGRAVYDAILFTARADRKDPCVEMREMMQKKK